MRQNIGYDTYKPLLDRFVSLIQERFERQIISAVLYGSVARGEAGLESDVDLLLVLDEIPSSYRERLRPLLPLLSRLRKEACWRELEDQGIFPSLSVLVLSREEADRNRYLYLDMLEDARLLVDRDGFFENRLEVLKERLHELGARKIRRNGGWYWDLKPGIVSDEVVTL